MYICIEIICRRRNGYGLTDEMAFELVGNIGRKKNIVYQHYRLSVLCFPTVSLHGNFITWKCFAKCYRKKKI